MNVQRDAWRDGARAWEQPGHHREAHDHQHCTRKQEEPVRCVQQHEAKAAPTVAETAQVRRTAALVRPKNDGNFRYSRADLRGLYDHLESEFHPGAADIQRVIERAREGAHAAITIPDAGTE